MVNPIRRFFARRRIRHVMREVMLRDNVNVQYEAEKPEMAYSDLESIDEWRVNAIERIRIAYDVNSKFLAKNDEVHAEYYWTISEIAGRLKTKDIATVLSA